MPELKIQERVDQAIVTVHPRSAMSNFYSMSVMAERRKLRYADFSYNGGNLITDRASDWSQPDRVDSAADVMERARQLAARRELAKVPQQKKGDEEKQLEHLAEIVSVKPTEFEVLGDFDLATISAASIQRGNSRLIEIVPPALWAGAAWCHEQTPMLCEPWQANGDLSVVAPNSDWAVNWTKFISAIYSPKMNALMFTPDPDEFEARENMDTGKQLRTLAVSRRLASFRRLMNIQASLLEAWVQRPMLELQLAEHTRIGETDMRDLIVAALDTLDRMPMEPITKMLSRIYTNMKAHTPDGTAALIPVLGKPDLARFAQEKEPLLGGSGQVLLTAMYSMKRSAAAFKGQTAKNGRIGLLKFLLDLRSVMREQTEVVTGRIAAVLGWNKAISAQSSGELWFNKPPMLVSDGDGISGNVYDALFGLAQSIPKTATKFWPLVPDRMKFEWEFSILPVPFVCDPDDIYEGATPHDLIPTGSHMGEQVTYRTFRDIEVARAFYGMDTSTLAGVMVNAMNGDKRFYAAIPGDPFYDYANPAGPSTNKKDTLTSYLLSSDRDTLKRSRIGVPDGAFYYNATGFNARVIVQRTYGREYHAVTEGKVSLAPRSELTWLNTGEVAREAGRPGAQAIFNLLKNAGVVRAETK